MNPEHHEPDVLKYERRLWDQGIGAIAGVDEVGRGCLFGDVVAAAVVLPEGLYIEDVNDSKQVSAKKREILFERIMADALAVGIGRVDAATIDRINIRQASRLAMKLAVQQLRVQPGHLLVDAETVDLPLPQTAVIRGDALSHSIAAASIIAKVTRDRLCLDWDNQFPEYGIIRHKGYATKRHRESLQMFGASPLHRKSFLRNVLHVQEELF